MPSDSPFGVTSHNAPPPIQGALFSFGQEDISNTHVVVCQDALGDKLYRFIVGRAGAEVWRAGDPQPRWVEAALLVEPQLEPKVG